MRPSKSFVVAALSLSLAERSDCAISISQCFLSKSVKSMLVMASSLNFDLKERLDINFTDKATLNPLCKSIASGM